VSVGMQHVTLAITLVHTTESNTSDIAAIHRRGFVKDDLWTIEGEIVAVSKREFVYIQD